MDNNNFHVNIKIFQWKRDQQRMELMSPCARTILQLIRYLETIIMESLHQSSPQEPEVTHPTATHPAATLPTETLPTAGPSTVLWSCGQRGGQTNNRKSLLISDMICWRSDYFELYAFSPIPSRWYIKGNQISFSGEKDSSIAISDWAVRWASHMSLKETWRSLDFFKGYKTMLVGSCHLHNTHTPRIFGFPSKTYGNAINVTSRTLIPNQVLYPRVFLLHENWLPLIYKKGQACR